MKVNPETGKYDTELSGSFMIEQEKQLLGIIIVSIDGVKENIVETILDLRDDEYTAIVAQVNEIYNGNLAKAK